MSAEVSSHDVARELRRRLPGAGIVKTHKLLYYCQGWHLTWHGQPMFRERIEAWTNGPVVGDLWADEKHGRAQPPATRLSADHLVTVDYVVSRYGALSGRDLITLTHGEDPWRIVSGADGFSAPTVITDQAMIDWFAQDEDFLARQTTVARLRRLDVNSFDPVPDTDAVRSAIGRALAGTHVEHTRPA